MTGACEGRVVSGNDLGVGCFNGEVWVDARQHREKQEKMRMWPHPGDSFENLRSFLSKEHGGERRQWLEKDVGELMTLWGSAYGCGEGRG